MATISFLKTKKIDFFLIGVIALAAILRLWRLPTDLLLHRDQGLHALGAWALWHEHNFKLLGHPTDVDGIFHGPFYYILISIPYFLGKGDPAVPAIFQVLVEVATLPFLYLGLTKLFNRQTAKLALIFYAVSHLLIGYSRWLNNVPPILPVANLLIYFVSFQLKQWSTKRFFVLGLLTGLIAQLDGAMAFSLVPALLFVFRKNLNPKTIFVFLSAFFIPSLPQLAFELRHDWVTLRAILNLFQGGDGFHLSLQPIFQSLRSFLEQIQFLLMYKFHALSVVLFCVSIYSLRHSFKTTYAFALSLFIIPVLTYGLLHRGAIGFFFIYTWPLMLGVIGFAILRFPKIISVLITIFIIGVNMYFNQSLLLPSQGLTPIGTSNLTTLQDRKNIIDWIYEQSDRQSFAIWSYTLPYFQDYPWTYTFLSYGQQKYGYLPEKTGSFSPNDLRQAKFFFNVYEPDYDKPENLVVWLKEVEKNFGPVKGTFKSNDLTVELREWQGN